MGHGFIETLHFQYVSISKKGVAQSKQTRGRGCRELHRSFASTRKLGAIRLHVEEEESATATNFDAVVGNVLLVHVIIPFIVATIDSVGRHRSPFSSDNRFSNSTQGGLLAAGKLQFESYPTFRRDILLPAKN
mmetsp:Transcript_25225/g.53195  ORF Transcript_25225/g.53195 Transcript_25225/m.53195 type:complete len:133 (-) Transcript_25225:618-1016(-)